MKPPLFDCAVLVLGMHRSGTSALAGVLARCGLGIPQQLLPPSEDNERGFYESARINELNSSILADLGQPWHSLEPIGDERWEAAGIARNVDEINALVADQFATTRFPLIKDPRICRLLPLWKQALAISTQDVRVAGIIRSPMEVALSLFHRNQIEIEAGILLWARYNLDAERHSRGLTRRFVTYDELLEDWRAALNKLELPVDPDAIDAPAIDAFLSRSLRHHDESKASAANVDLAAQCFEILNRWTCDGEDQSDYPRLDNLRSKLDDMGPVLNELSEKGRLERKRRANLATQSAKTEAQLASREKQFAGMAEAVERSLREIEKRSEAFNQQAQEFARAMRLAEERDRALREVAEEKLRAAAQNLAAEKEEEIRRLTAGHLDLVKKLSSEKQALDAELRLAKRKYRSTGLILQREKSRALRLQSEIDRANAQIRVLEGSIAVRFSRILRSLFHTAADVLVLRGAASSRKQMERRLIKDSGYFDANWYLEAYPDVAAAGSNPVAHFVELGWREGRNPGPYFSSTRYLRRYPDVAETGANPLLHFIEHGRFEGREVYGVGELPQREDELRPAPKVSLQPAMPVFAGNSELRKPQVWRRSCQLATLKDALLVDGLGVTTIDKLEARQEFEALKADFEALSGASPHLAAELASLAEFPEIKDGWFATTHRLITRWNVVRPTVIRAIQVDPDTEQLALVGEGLATGALDPVAFDLASPAMPLLFIASSCDGELVGARIMAFPSLFRGGAHYSESIEIGHGSRLDTMECSEVLERQLRLLRAGTANPMVQAVEVDLAGADGTGPLFGRSLRDLLERVLMIDLSAASADEAGPRNQLLAQAVQASARIPFRRKGGKLSLAADMTPSLSILVSPLVQSRPATRKIPMGLIVNDADPSQPAVRFDPPEIKSGAASGRSEHYSLPFPSLSGASAKGQLAALRRIGRSLDDAELLVPDAAFVADGRASEISVDWLVDPNQWSEALLGQSIAALGLQRGIGRQRLLFIGNPSPFINEVARTALGSEPAIFSDPDSALTDATATVVGNLGAGLLLHDPRTASILASILFDTAVSTASCAIVASSKQGKSWRTRIVDRGLFPIDRKVVFGPRADSPAEMIWRSTYPVTEPSKLWLARPDDVRHWRAGDQSGKEVHLLTSIVSASLEGEPQEDSSGMQAAPAAGHRSIKAKVLVG